MLTKSGDASESKVNTDIVEKLNNIILDFNKNNISVMASRKTSLHMYSSCMYLASSSLSSSNDSYFSNTNIQYASVKMNIFSAILQYCTYLRNDIFTVTSHTEYEISEFLCCRT